MTSLRKLTFFRLPNGHLLPLSVRPRPSQRPPQRPPLAQRKAQQSAAGDALRRRGVQSWPGRAARADARRNTDELT